MPYKLLLNFILVKLNSCHLFKPRVFPKVFVSSPPVLPNSTSLFLPFVYPDQDCVCVSYFFEHATLYAPVSYRIHFRNTYLRFRIKWDCNEMFLPVN
jgi:hypothetical protein